MHACALPHHGCSQQDLALCQLGLCEGSCFGQILELVSDTGCVLHTYKQKDLNIKKLAKLKDAQAQMRSCPCLEVRNQGKSGKGAGMALLQAKELNAALCKTCALQALPPCETV